MSLSQNKADPRAFATLQNAAGSEDSPRDEGPLAKKRRDDTIHLVIGTVAGGQLCEMKVDRSTLVRDLYRKAEAAAGKPLKLLADTVYLRSTSSVNAAGLQDGQLITAVTHMPRIYAQNGLYAAVKGDGSVHTWAWGSRGAVREQLEGSTHIYSTSIAYAARKEGGAVVTWGLPEQGGDSSGVQEQLARGIIEVSSTCSAFAALKEDGSVVAWGDALAAGHRGQRGRR